MFNSYLHKRVSLTERDLYYLFHGKVLLLPMWLPFLLFIACLGWFCSVVYYSVRNFLYGDYEHSRLTELDRRVLSVYHTTPITA